MHQIWVMYFTFKRRHYDKSPLVWLANVTYWKEIQHPLYAILQDNPHILVEYPVENFHSLLRARTNEYDTPQRIQEKSRWIDRNKTELQNFSTWFVPPRRATLTQNKLRRLKIRTEDFLLSTLTDICKNAGAATELPRLLRQPRRTTRWQLPQLFGDGFVNNELLPLGFQFDGYRPALSRLGFPNANVAPPVHPREDRRCDFLQCLLPNSPLPVQLHSCGHSFHNVCVPAEYCYIC